VSDERRSRPRGEKRRSASSILRAAKSVGCHSVKFPDGTVVTIAPAGEETQAAADEWADARPK
jgi:hypothetical protein